MRRIIVYQGAILGSPFFGKLSLCRRHPCSKPGAGDPRTICKGCYGENGKNMETAV